MPDIDHIGQLTSDPANRRRHNPRNVGMIASSLGEVGAARSIVIDEHGVILAGNATIEAAAQAGIERLRVIETDGEEIIAVRRIGLTDAQKRRLAIADNRTAELAEWDVEQLLADLNAGESFDGLFTDAELDALLADIRTPEPGADPGAQVDRAEELRAKWQTARGDLWLIGPHRLLCGDATNADDVARLMDGAQADMVFADPPFGIAYTGHGASKDGRANKFTPIAGDATPDAGWLPLCVPKPDGAIYLKTTWAVLHAWEAALSAVVSLRSHIVWDKCSHVAGDVQGGYATQNEIVLFGSADRHKIGRFDTDVWRIPRATTGSPDDRTGHPYESPVELSQHAIDNSTASGDVVLDPFVGSGTTIVAAEQTGRVCYGMEIEPKYVAVCLERLAGMGLEPRRAG